MGCHQIKDKKATNQTFNQALSDKEQQNGTLKQIENRENNFDQQKHSQLITDKTFGASQQIYLDLCDSPPKVLGSSQKNFQLVVAEYRSPNKQTILTPRTKMSHKLAMQKQSLIDFETENVDVLSEKKLTARKIFRQEKKEYFEALNQIF